MNLKEASSKCCAFSLGMTFVYALFEVVSFAPCVLHTDCLNPVSPLSLTKFAIDVTACFLSFAAFVSMCMNARISTLLTLTPVPILNTAQCVLGVYFFVQHVAISYFFALMFPCALANAVFVVKLLRQNNNVSKNVVPFASRNEEVIDVTVRRAPTTKNMSELVQNTSGMPEVGFIPPPITA